MISYKPEPEWCTVTVQGIKNMIKLQFVILNYNSLKLYCGPIFGKPEFSSEARFVTINWCQNTML